MGRTRRSEPHRTRPAEIQGDRFRPLWLGTFVALCVATPLLPSETALFGGSTLVLMLLWWMLLAAWSLTAVARGGMRLRLGPASWALFALLAWHSTSAIVMAWHGNPRASLNMLWQWISLGTAFFLGRQLFRHEAERRGMVAVMMATAVSLATVGFYQYYRELPATRAAYEKDPERVLRSAGVHAPPGSPQRKVFEDRLNSTEPIATFALTNSLAGFLAPWWIALLGITLSNWERLSRSRWSVATAITALLLVLGCLVLTKSRTAWLATLFAVGLLAVYGRRAGWRPDWRVVAGLGAAAIVLPFLAVVFGGLDWLVVLESSKSFLFRVQYWRSTAELIADYPWFGTGPGNFQQYYTAYKLPEASETIAEPHNFLFEVWATAGTPALAALLALFAGIAWQVRRAERLTTAGAVETPAPASTSVVADEAAVPRPFYWGALAGGALGYILCGFLEGYFPSAGLIGLGFPLAAAFLSGWHRWIEEGTLSNVVLATPLIAMLINFLAAGGIGFGGVAQSLWVLAALLLNQAEDPLSSTHKNWEVPLGRIRSAVVAAVIVILLVLFHQTAYSPVTEAQTAVQEGDTQRMLGRFPAALEAYRQAAKLDPFSAEPWERQAALLHELWLHSGDAGLEGEFRAAVRAELDRHSRSGHAHLLAGHQWLAAYRRFGRQEYLAEAVRHYGIAVSLYPNYNVGRAQFAWALHLSGEASGAAAEAAEALHLDAANPHQEQKLAKQQIIDMPPADAAKQPPSAGDRTAEQVVEDLRKP